MSSAREKIGRFLPGWLIDHPQVKEGFASLVSDLYRAPSNKTEAEAHKDLMQMGCTVLRRGWPDFFVFADADDFFMVEVKAPSDFVRPSQRVILETLARKGIDVYVFGGNDSDLYHSPETAKKNNESWWSGVEAVGPSTPWSERYERMTKKRVA